VSIPFHKGGSTDVPQEQQGLYQRLRGAEARLLQADTDAAAARHQLDAADQTEVCF
jgi:hypothetical protein